MGGGDQGDRGVDHGTLRAARARQRVSHAARTQHLQPCSSHPDPHQRVERAELGMERERALTPPPPDYGRRNTNLKEDAMKGLRRRRLIRTAAVASCCCALVTGVPLTAEAAQDNGNSSCVILDYCAYTSPNFGGSIWTWFGDDNIWPTVINNKEDSVWNRSGTYTVRVYDGTGFSNYIYCTPPNSFYGTMGINNRGSSHTWNGSC